MRPPLQDFGFDQSEYERPTQPWVCGWTVDGRPCRIGPDRRGHCRATFECKPLSKNDRWFCTRSAAEGGKCAEGPLPHGKCARRIPKCQPVRTVRSQRGLVVRSVSAFTIGAVLMFAGPVLSDLRDAVVSPGALSGSHAAITDCSTCHAIGVDADEVERAARSERNGRCIECHRIPNDDALGAHGIDETVLAAVSQRIADEHTSSLSPSTILAGLAPGVPRNARGELACSTCHGEHRGANANVTELSDHRCQACHEGRIADFASGHREFVDYPDYPSAGDSFEHDEPSEHEGTCRSCHYADAGGVDILTRGYDSACADCHEDEMEGEYPSPRRERRSSPEPVELLSRFSHAPHLATACGDCHAYGSTTDIAPIAKTACSACHTSGRVTQRCLTCHVYHSERFALTQPGSR